jgi:hypothetical protein
MTFRICATVLVSVAALAVCSCGGSTETSFEPGATGGTAGAGGAAGPGGAAGAGQGGSSGGAVDAGGGFNPGAIVLPGGPGSTFPIDAGAGAIDAASVAPVPPGDAGASTSAPPTPAVIYGCAELCAKEATISCPAQQTVADCRTGCSLALANPKCTQTTEALFECAKTATPACGDDGKAMLKGCEAQTLLASGCFLTNAVDPAMSTPCATFCGRVAATQCPNDGTVADCIGGCSVMGNLIAGCGAPWNGYITCANAAPTMACGDDGKAWAPACLSQALSFWACAITLYQTVTAADAGP